MLGRVLGKKKRDNWPKVNKNQEGLSYRKKVKVKSLSRVRLFATPWTVARQAPVSMGFSRQEYWSGLPRVHTLRDLMPGDLVTERYVVGPAACLSKANKQPQLVGRKVCFISDASNWWEREDTCFKANSPNPTWQAGVTAFVDRAAEGYMQK